MAIKDKELEKELKAMIKEVMDYSKDLVATLEKNLKTYIDKKVDAAEKSNAALEKSVGDLEKNQKELTSDVSTHVKELMGYTRTVAGEVEKNLKAYIDKKTA